MKLALKGKRNYLTGADIINFSLNKIIKKKNVIFNFHKFSKKFLVIKKFNYRKKIPKKDIVSTIVTFTKKKRPYFKFLSETKLSEKKKFLMKMNCSKIVKFIIGLLLKIIIIKIFLILLLL